jgi:hypothetical protein
MNYQTSTTTERKSENSIPALPMYDDKMPLPRLLYTIKETAYMLGVSEKSVRRFLQRGLLKTNPTTRTKIITAASIQAFAKMTL